MILNSIVSTSRSRYAILDIKNFYLYNKLPSPEYMRIDINIIPKQIIQEYKLNNIVHNGYVYIEINKGMYGLPQSGKIANDKLTIHLARFGYHPYKRTPGLWSHQTRPIQFSLVVDDFAVKYERKENLNHLLKMLESKNEMTIDL